MLKASLVVGSLLLSCAARGQAPPSSIASSARIQQMESAIKDGSFVKIGSILVAKNGKLIYERYFDGDAATLRDTRSATKSITSALVGIAIDRRQIASVNTPILSILPERPRENADPRKAKITVEDLLTMSSPLECDDWNDASRGNEERMYPIEDWLQFFLDLPIRGYMKNPGDTPPPYGRHFSYCTAGAFALSPILSHATGMPADRYAQTNLFDPLGIHDAQWVYSPLGIPQTGGGLRLSSRDLLRFAELYRNHGVVDGKQIVSKEWVASSTTPHAHIPDQVDDYGYFWWIKPFTAAGGASYPAFYMTGNGGNKVVVIPSLELTIVITSTNYNTRGMHQQTEKLITDYILPAAQ